PVRIRATVPFGSVPQHLSRPPLLSYQLSPARDPLEGLVGAAAAVSQQVAIVVEEFPSATHDDDLEAVEFVALHPAIAARSDEVAKRKSRHELAVNRGLISHAPS